MTGDWKASLQATRQINLNFERRTKKAAEIRWAKPMIFADLQGLSRETGIEAGGPVKFSLVREAEQLTAKAVLKMARARERFVLNGTRVLFPQ